MASCLFKALSCGITKFLFSPLGFQSLLLELELELTFALHCTGVDTVLLDLLSCAVLALLLKVILENMMVGLLWCVSWLLVRILGLGLVARQFRFSVWSPWSPCVCVSGWLVLRARLSLSSH